MGNCGRKPQQKDVTAQMFCPLKEYVDVESITMPSKCEYPSFTLSIQGSQKSDSSQYFKWSRMMSLIIEQQHFTEQLLTKESLRITSLVMEIVKKNLRTICDDVLMGVITMPDLILDKFKLLVEKTFSNPQQSFTNTTVVPPVIKKVLTHFVVVIYFHDQILEFFKAGKNDMALDLLKQIAVSHALKGITPLEFRLLDWFLIHFLMKNQLIPEEGFNNFVTYLNTITNHIANFYETQSINGKNVEEMISEKPENDRMNKHRENYRIMKKWAISVQDCKEQEDFVELLLDQNRPDALKGQEESIDTLTLKENDFIMKHFIKKKTSAANLDTESSKISTVITGFPI